MKTLDQVKAELNEVLKPYLGQPQNGTLEVEAQKAVNRYFTALQRKNEFVLIEAAGLRIIGVELNFDIGSIGLKRIKTDWWPTDAHAVHRTVPNAIALGYANGYQLYLEGANIVARYGMGACCTKWCPSIQGIPAYSTVFFLALERAKQLGYLSELRQ